MQTTRVVGGRERNCGLIDVFGDVLLGDVLKGKLLLTYQRLVRAAGPPSAEAG